MRKKLRIAGIASVGFLAVVVVMVFTAYRASQVVPKEYEEALALDKAVLQSAGQEMGTRVTTLYNDARRRGEWHTLFTAEQINGWLAFELPEKHGELLPPDIRDPRVAIAPESIVLAFRAEKAGVSTVFSLHVEPYIGAPNVLGLRLRSAKAGALPVPLGQVVGQVSEAARNLRIPIRWTQIDGDPAVLVTLEAREGQDKVLILDSLELRTGELYLAGHTYTAAEYAKLQEGLVEPPDVALQSGENSTRQK